MMAISGWFVRARRVMHPVLLYRSGWRYEQLLRRLSVNDESLLFEPSFNPLDLPAGARDYLCHENPRLQELIRRYRDAGHPVLEHSVWTDDFAAHEVDLQFFRGDQAFVWQFRDLNTELHYLATFQYLKALDDLNLIGRCVEDGLFGAYTFNVEDAVVSRDLLDSINEIYFLERTLGLSQRSNFNILDIGAGYGRLAHRFLESLPDVGRIFCVDAVAVSTFLCEYYLKFRGADDRASVVALDELDALLARQHIDLAVNVHSFSECSLRSIRAWVEIISNHDIRYLFIVPNPGIDRGAQLLSHELKSSSGPKHRDIFPIIAERGYRLVNREPKYRDELMQRHGITPTHYYLFERTASDK